MVAWRYEFSLFPHSKINFVSSRGHVIFSISFTYLTYILIHIKSRITKSTSPSITKLESLNDPVICQHGGICAITGR